MRKISGSDEARKGFYDTPAYNYLLDPTVPSEMFASKTSKQGMVIIERKGSLDKYGNKIYDIFDWIGENSYPNPTDWFEEIMELGFHQLIERTAQFNLLSRESKYIAVHKRAGMQNAAQYYKERMGITGTPLCPVDDEKHLKPSKEFLKSYPDLCAGLLWNNIVDGDVVDGRLIERKLPSLSYYGYSALGGDKDISIPSMFFRFPIGKFCTWLIYTDSNSNAHEDALKALEALDESLKTIKIVSL